MDRIEVMVSIIIVFQSSCFWYGVGDDDDDDTELFSREDITS